MPVDVGLPGGVRRRTPGLRREEVAVLAGVSPTWYTYLEQARDVSPSAEVLDNLATVLGLTPYERKYLHNLSQESADEPESACCPEFQLLLTDLTAAIDPIPAYVCSHSGDLLGWNRAAADWLADFTDVPAERRNILVWMLTAEEARDRFVDWENRCRHLVARFRAEVATAHETSRVAELVRDLSQRSPLFRGWWEEHEVAGPDSAEYLMRHPSDGVVTVRTVELLYRELLGCAKVVIHMPRNDLTYLGGARGARTAGDRVASGVPSLPGLGQLPGLSRTVR
ncbi:helix-turn-helix domain-containing protein [Streptomyces sp. SID5468]|nr:helix-turn-helix domain-containing protein [Streptomyces sp. SID5468]